MPAFKQALNNHISFLAWPSMGCILTLTLIPALAQQTHNTSSPSRFGFGSTSTSMLSSCLVLSCPCACLILRMTCLQVSAAVHQA
ncbi:hypothetical protein DFH08DRAFT_39650 [Mycena albidolilacea]|uniref:Uncharacterized protein n=1 Tax=Mycena albidolilacea TaxID=1033008 RepID=A0AAD7AW72_9AGAR|nr:hypothetical protein DFH08DRAFT_39650 [Mycena albidolilacea]